MLEYQIDRRLVLRDESEFKSLYGWCIQELDSEGAKIGRDLIPWPWDAYFTAKELTLSDGVMIDRGVQRGDVSASVNTREKQFIHAKLQAGFSTGSYRQPAYSMLGTDRVISEFELFIEKLEETDEQERCFAQGIVSYTHSDIEYGTETTNDAITFYLHVRPRTFSRYAAAVAASEVDEAILCVRMVAGLYAEWSPSIWTDLIKVLTGDEEHKVEIPSNCAISPRRLGDVGEASFTMRRTAKPEKRNPDTVDDELAENEVLQADQRDTATQTAERLANINLQVVVLLGSLRTAAWVIVGLLVLILAL
jgi:hypothetical protein